MDAEWTAERIEREVRKLLATECTLSKPCTFKPSDSCGENLAHLEASHFTQPKAIVCRYCGSADIMKYGVRNSVQDYICRKCHRKFRAKDAPEGMRTPTEQIGAALNMFYDGMSFADIGRHLGEAYANPVNPSSVYRWIVRYTTKAIIYFDDSKPKVSDTFIVDETVLKVGGEKWWFWDIIDEETRYLLASHLSPSRTMGDVTDVMRLAQKRAGKAPRFIVSDGMKAYPDGIDRVFGRDTVHIKSRGLSDEASGNLSNLIERFHGTLKERTKVLRGFKAPHTALLILDGFLVYYNFFRPHSTLGKSPAEAAGIKSDITTWTDVVRRLQ